MNNSFQHDRYDAPEKSSVTGKLKSLDCVLNWLAGLFQLTEEEQEDAGVFLGSKSGNSFSTEQNEL